VASADSGYDIDLGAVWRGVARNWVLIVALVVIGVLVGVGLTQVTGKRYEAASAVYLGQPTDANGNAITGVNSNPKGAAQIVQSGAVLRQAAAEVGVPAERLRGEVTVDAPTVTVKSVSAPTNFVSIAVRDRQADIAVEAANALGRILVERLSTYPHQKIAVLNRQIVGDRKRLAGLQERIEEAQDALAAIAAGGASAAERATASAAYAAIIQSASTLRDSLIQRLQASELARVVARDIEMPSLFSEASAPAGRVSPGLALAALAGIVAGLVVGIAAALVRERLRRSSPAE